MTEPHLKAAFHTLGCKTNHYETDAVAERFRQAGFQCVDFDQPADVYVLNTCTVTAEADRKSRQHLRRARSVNPDAIVVALGCHAQLNQDSPLADIVIGTQGKLNAVDLILAMLKEKGRFDEKGPDSAAVLAPDSQEHARAAQAVSPVPAAKPLTHVAGPLEGHADYDEYGPVRRQSETRAYIKIEDGCDNFCAYCAIPLARGRVRSRDPERVLEEAALLAEAGYREVVLTGIHICSYGAERGQGSEALPELAIQIGRIAGIDRIRFGSLEPQSITPLFADLAAAVPGLCPHFHLSLQSGSDSVLSRMNRRYDTDRFRESVKLLRARFPEAALTTDVIVGYPGETEGEFETLLRFVEEMRFDRVGCFTYSYEAGTPSADLPGQADEDVKNARRDLLMSVQQPISLARNQAFVGRTLDVLVEGHAETTDEDGTPTGQTITLARSYRDAPEIDGYVLVEGELPAGEIVPVRVTGALVYDLLATPNLVPQQVIAPGTVSGPNGPLR